MLHDNLDIGRPDQVSLIFDRRIRRTGRHPTPGRFRTRIITEGVVPSLHIDYKNAKIKRHKEGRALRTEITINDTGDFKLSKRLINLPALRQIGFTANRRLLRVQRLSHDPIPPPPSTGSCTTPTSSSPTVTATGSPKPHPAGGQPPELSTSHPRRGLIWPPSGRTIWPPVGRTPGRQRGDSRLWRTLRDHRSACHSIME